MTLPSYSLFIHLWLFSTFHWIIFNVALISVSRVAVFCTSSLSRLTPYHTKNTGWTERIDYAGLSSLIVAIYFKRRELLSPRTLHCDRLTEQASGDAYSFTQNRCKCFVVDSENTNTSKWRDSGCNFKEGT